MQKLWHDKVWGEYLDWQTADKISVSSWLRVRKRWLALFRMRDKAFYSMVDYGLVYTIP